MPRQYALIHLNLNKQSSKCVTNNSTKNILFSSVGSFYFEIFFFFPLIATTKEQQEQQEQQGEEQEQEQEQQEQEQEQHQQ